MTLVIVWNQCQNTLPCARLPKCSTSLPLPVIPLSASICFLSFLRNTNWSLSFSVRLSPRQEVLFSEGQTEFFVSRTNFSLLPGGGISSYAGVPGGAAKSLEACLEQAVKEIPKFRHHQTPLYLGATAGMRLLKSVQVPIKTGYNTIITAHVLIS